MVRSSILVLVLAALTIAAAKFTSIQVGQIESAKRKEEVLLSFDSPLCIRIEDCARASGTSLHSFVVSDQNWEFALTCSEFGPGRSGRMYFEIGVTELEMRKILDSYQLGSEFKFEWSELSRLNADNVTGRKFVPSAFLFYLTEDREDKFETQ